MNREKLSYKDSGVDIEEGQRAVELMKNHVKSTYNENVLCELGGFGGLFELNLKNMKNPVLVSGTDGVGTKLKIAFMMNTHDTVGVDLVAMCVNDILCQGAKPLFFLDYLATGVLEAEKISDIVSGIAKGCKEAGAALIGGETAEMPGFYQEGEYDLAGFAVGIVDKEKIIDGKQIEEGDALIGLSSSGIHSNGYSLARKVFFDKKGYEVDKYIDKLEESLGEALIKPTRIYVNPVLNILEKFEVKGMVHITGGGFYENIPRILPNGLEAEINLNSWKVPPVFEVMQELGNVDREEMFKTFNMGIGFILAVRASDKEEVLGFLKNLGELAFEIGTVKAGVSGVSLCER
jgi:phosphoribosylformylglycinamidine cyclo-ligase